MTANFSVGARGEFLGCPAEVRIFAEQGELGWQGVIHVRGQRIAEIAGRLNGEQPGDSLLGELLTVVDDIVGQLDLDADVRHDSQLTLVQIDMQDVQFRALNGPATTALTLYLASEPSPTEGKVGWILGALSELRDTLGIHQLVLTYTDGQPIALPTLIGRPINTNPPSALGTPTWLAHGEFVFDQNTLTGRAMSALLGVSTALDAYVGIDPDKSIYEGFLSLGPIDNQYFRTTELYMGARLDGLVPTFSFHGSFCFKSLPDAAFMAACDLGLDSFTLAASMTADPRIALPGAASWITVAEAGLLIGFENAQPMFGMFATLYLRDLMIFGAVILTLEGESIPTPSLVSGAISPVSLPSLYRNLTGSDLLGLDDLDVISLQSLSDLQMPEGFDPAVLDQRDKHALATYFNAAVKDPSLALKADAVEIRQGPADSFAVIDTARMRHYFVSREGTISLESQFYFCTLLRSRQFGDYTVSPGIFFCGALEVFGTRFEAIFSMREDDGLLAYAKVDPIQFIVGSFTIFTLQASQDNTKDPQPIDGGGVADQFITRAGAGAVFFLSATKTETAFFFSGNLTFLELFSLDARVAYSKGYISIHTEVQLWGIRVLLQLDVSWRDYSSSRFGFRLAIDTTQLLQALNSVTQAIEAAIKSLQATVGEAESDLDAAQRRVDQLYNEMRDFDDRIAACNQAIDDADWWYKPFIAIAKGAEIAAYEVAEAGIWTAIQIATAALDLAKAAVSAFGELGTEVLELVNSAIHDVTNLFFLRSAEIVADVSPGQQVFKAQIAFRALGKDYNFSAEVKLDLLQGGSLLSFLTGRLLDVLSPDLKKVEAGQPPALPTAPRQIFALSDPSRNLLTPEEAPAIEGAAQEIRRAQQVMDLMQARYRAEFGTDLPQSAALNSSFSAALSLSASSLEVAHQAALPAGHLLARASRLDMSGLTDDETGPLLEAKANLSQAGVSDVHVVAAQENLRLAQSWAAAQLRDFTPPSEPESLSRSPAQTDERMAQFLQNLQDEIDGLYRHSTAGYIDLSQEATLKNHMADACETLGHPVAPDEPMRLRALALEDTGYRQRLS